ncbi:MAG: hypothetical protein K2X44_04435, partial [Magnetospirillum sp.]|nr:hypothetical protein [Magnetospirillum sp.]
AYNVVSSGDPMVTLYGYLDGLLFKMLNAKGTVSFDINAKAIPVMKYKFIGEYSPVSDTTFPTGAVFTGFQKPLTVGKVNTPTFTIHGHAGVCQALSFDAANEVNYRDLINAAGAYSPDRSPVGSASIELPSVAAANFAELTRTAAEGVLQLVHGTVAGNIVQFDAPKVQFTAPPQVTNDSDVAMVGLQFSLNPNAGNDEFVLTVK